MIEQLKIFMQKLKRVSFDLIALFISLTVILVLIQWNIFSLNDKAEYFFGLIFMKFILVSCGILHFHITRKLMFPYIDFKEEKEWSNNAMIIAMFIIIVFSWSRGG